MKRVLITGFGPFPGVPRNPSQEAALRLARLRRPALEAIAREVAILPTQWSALAPLAVRLTEASPDAVLMLGVASRRRRSDVEMRAVNAARGVDAAGMRPAARLKGRAIHRARAPVPALAHALRQAGLRAGLSRDAGRYLCNAAYFTALETLAGTPVVFIHLPGRGRESRRSPAQVAFALSQVLKALLRARRS